MFFDDILQYVPYLRLKALHHPLRRLDIVGQLFFDQLLHDKGFKQFDGHFLRQTALIDLKLRAYDDNGPPRIVNTFAQ